MVWVVKPYVMATSSYSYIPSLAEAGFTASIQCGISAGPAVREGKRVGSVYHQCKHMDKPAALTLDFFFFSRHEAPRAKFDMVSW